MVIGFAPESGIAVSLIISGCATLDRPKKSRLIHMCGCNPNLSNSEQGQKAGVRPRHPTGYQRPADTWAW